jgi:NAD(P)-dependent dehydrogenase (short-subunit alcohol dehydrogenase family)
MRACVLPPFERARYCLLTGAASCWGRMGKNSMDRNMGKAALVAFVTGGAQGIGLATSRMLLERGYHVAIADIDEEAGQEAVSALAVHGPVRFYGADVAREEDVRAAISHVAETLSRIDLLVNNAAVVDPATGPVEELTTATWERIIAVNLTGPFLCAKHATPHLRARHGAIVNVASTRALMSERNTEAYAATKGGLVSLTHALAVSLGPEVRVNCVSPGFIDVSEWQKASARVPAVLSSEDHAQHPAGRVGRPDDVARAILFLADPANSFLTGAHLVLDGGMTRKMVYL